LPFLRPPLCAQQMPAAFSVKLQVVVGKADERCPYFYGGNANKVVRENRVCKYKRTNGLGQC
jgi:hypothetical protein